jgi:hypothetical protein
MSEGQVREKGVIKKEQLYKSVMVIIERLLPHPRRGGATLPTLPTGRQAAGRLLPKGEGEIK